MTAPVPSRPSRDAESGTDRLAVLALWPGWRWAIVPASLAAAHPAIPFYRRSTAVQRAQEYVTEPGLFTEGILLLRRRWFRRIEVEDHIPKPAEVEQEADDA